MTVIVDVNRPVRAVSPSDSAPLLIHRVWGDSACACILYVVDDVVAGESKKFIGEKAEVSGAVKP
jgi:hypothetical protein